MFCLGLHGVHSVLDEIIKLVAVAYREVREHFWEVVMICLTTGGPRRSHQVGH